MEFITLALSRFKLNFEDDHRRFVRSLTLGIDKVYTELQEKVEYDSIMPLVKKHRLVVIRAPWPRNSVRTCPRTWNHSATSWW